MTGIPEPDVEWYKDGKRLRESKQLTFLYDENDNCKLIITEGRLKDAGEYKVTAVNPHGQVSCTAQLIIKDQAESGESDSDGSGSEVSDDDIDAEEEKIIKKDKITSLYTVKEELGKGRFGVVCKCVRKKDGKEFAAKFIKCSKAQDKDDVLHEVEIMQAVGHKTLLRLVDAFQTASEFILVMELVTGGELFERVVEDEFISENEVIHYMKQILEGVEHMHSKNVLHLDLKPENIMIVRPNSNRIKLIDFGLARKYNPKENLKVMFGTPEFVAPEVLTYDRITPATDLWSIGVIAYVLLSGLSPFMGDNDAETLVNVQTAEWDFDDEVFDDISDDAKDYISNVLVLKASKRLTVEQCLEHTWLTVKRERGKINTNRLKAFTARRKWKKALTAIRSTNFLSKLLGSRGSDDGSKPGGGGGGTGGGGTGGGGGGGAGGLLARVKAMHVAGVQAPQSAPASSPFLSPASAAEQKPPVKKSTSEPASPKSPAAAENKPSSSPSTRTNAEKTTNGVHESKPVKVSESKSIISKDDKPTMNNARESKTTKDNSAVSDSSKSVSNDISKKDVESKSTASKDSTSNEPKESTTPSKTTSNDTKKTPEPRSNTRTPQSVPAAKGKLPQWPPPQKERPQKRGLCQNKFVL